MSAGARNLWRRLAGPFRDFGGLDGALYSIDRVLGGASGGRCRLFVYDLMVQPIGAKPLLAPNRLKNLHFAEIPQGHPDVERMPARADIKALRFEQGAKCIGAYRNDKLIGFVWLCFDAYREDEVRCTYRLAQPQCSVFDFDLYVFPEYRMGTAFIAVWHGANAYLSERGIRWTFSRVTRFNLASRRSHLRLGAVRRGTAVFLKLGPLEIMGSTVAPWSAVLATQSQRAVLCLAPAAAAEACDPTAPGVESSS